MGRCQPHVVRRRVRNNEKSDKKYRFSLKTFSNEAGRKTDYWGGERVIKKLKPGYQSSNNGGGNTERNSCGILAKKGGKRGQKASS